MSTEAGREVGESPKTPDLDKEEQLRLRAAFENKQNSFRLYLEQSGVMDKLSKALLRLFEEPNPPADPIAYFKRLIARDDFDPETQELERLSLEIRDLKTSITGLSEENTKIRAALGMPVEVMKPNARIIPSATEVQATPVNTANEKPTLNPNPSRDGGSALNDKKKKQ